MRNEARRNRVKAMLATGKKVVGTFLASHSSSNLEVLAMAGFDFVVIDAEHSMKNPETIEHLIVAAEAAGITPFVRIQEDIGLIERTLSVGARGLMVPMCNTREYAQSVVDAAKYAPIGKRGVCNTRVVDYGIRGLDSMAALFKAENDELMIMVQIETREAVENIGGILSVKGVDACFIGTLDLSHSLGVSCQLDDPLVDRHVQTVIKAAKDAHVPIGVLTFDAEGTNRSLDQGYDLVTMSCDTLFLAQTAVREVGAVKR